MAKKRLKLDFKRIAVILAVTLPIIVSLFFVNSITGFATAPCKQGTVYQTGGCISNDCRQGTYTSVCMGGFLGKISLGCVPNPNTKPSCNSDQTCSSGKCLTMTGKKCSSSSECLSGGCYLKRCCIKEGAYSSTGAVDCCSIKTNAKDRGSGAAIGAGTCVATNCLAAGKSTTASSNCCTGKSVNGKCAVDVGEKCDYFTPCSTGKCVNNKCCVNLNSGCNSGSDCCSGTICNSNLHICVLCSSSCVSASTIPCGQSYINGCGDSCGKGTKCNTGYKCGTDGRCANAIYGSMVPSPCSCVSSDQVPCGKSYVDTCGNVSCGKGTQCSTGYTCGTDGRCANSIYGSSAPSCTSTGCPSSSDASCGSSVTDNCGNSCGKGTKCSSGYSCTSSGCKKNAGNEI